MNDQTLTFAAQESSEELPSERKVRAKTAGVYTKKIPSRAFYPSEDVQFDQRVSKKP